MLGHAALDDRHPAAGLIDGGDEGSEWPEGQQLGASRVLVEGVQLPGLKTPSVCRDLTAHVWQV
jgi:hypothetical protein